MSIEDSGPGIPDNKRQHIFNRFVQLNKEKSDGFGLGLSIVKKVVERHHGDITIEDSSLGGVLFLVTFPLSKSPSAQDETPSNPQSSQLTVLVIDDNVDILAFIESILSPKYQVITAQTADLGLKIARRTLPDLLIVDIGMPEMDGFELVKHIRENNQTKNIPVIFATARSHPNDQIKALGIGGDAYITKPFTPEQLLAYVNRFVNTKNLQEKNPQTQSEQPKSLLVRAKNIIKESISDTEFGVQELAAALAMSRSALYRKFKEEVDISPAEYISRCRMEEADKLLKTTQLSVSKIAQLTGFKQVSTFTRSFNRFYGHNPSQHPDR